MPTSASNIEQKLQVYFAGKPHSYKIFVALQKQIQAQGDCQVQIASQISFGTKRKFAWVWLYNVSGSNPEGTVQIMLAIDKKIESPAVYRITQISKNRWNHLVVVHSMSEATNPDVSRLVQAAYRYGAG